MAKPVLEPLTAQGVVGDVLLLDWKPQQLMDISFASGAGAGEHTAGGALGGEPSFLLHADYDRSG